MGENDYFEPRTENFAHYYHVPASMGLSGWYNSDHRKTITYHANAGMRFFEEKDRRNMSFYFETRWRTSDKLTLNIGIGNSLLWNNIGGLWSDQVYAEVVGYGGLPANPIVLGRRDVVGFNNNIGANYSFNNKMNIALYARHYWQRVMYHDFSNLQSDGSLLPSTYTGTDATGNPINNIAANYFNIDFVYTWRFAPGSDVLFVYKNFIGHEAIGHDVKHNYIYNLGHLPDFAGSNSLSVKILYFLDYDRMRKGFRKV
jgi:hypothetical protein